MYPAGITLGCDLAVTVAVAHPVLAYILSTGIPYRRKIISLSIYTPMRLIEYEFLSDFQQAPSDFLRKPLLWRNQDIQKGIGVQDQHLP